MLLKITELLSKKKKSQTLLTASQLLAMGAQKIL